MYVFFVGVSCLEGFCAVWRGSAGGIGCVWLRLEVCNVGEFVSVVRPG